MLAEASALCRLSVWGTSEEELESQPKDLGWHWSTAHSALGVIVRTQLYEIEHSTANCLSPNELARPTEARFSQLVL